MSTEQDFNQTTYYRHPSWAGTERKAVPLMQRHTVGKLVAEILQANTNNQSTSILYIGKSGSGKSTLTQTLTHRLHLLAHKKLGRDYIVKWFEKGTFGDAPNIIKRLQKRPHIINFEDASYSLDGMSQSQISEMAAEMTYVRHRIKHPVIFQIQSHYSKSIQKFFRDTEVTIATSITDNERTNFQALFGKHNGFKVNNFIHVYSSALFRGRFGFMSDPYENKQYFYNTNDPFRPALVSSVGRCHHLLYPREFCGHCTSPENVEFMEKLDPQEVIDTLIKSSTPALARRGLSLFGFFALGKKTLDSSAAASWRMLNRLAEKYEIDWDKVLELSDTQLKVPRKKGYKFTKRQTRAMQELNQNIKEKSPFKDY